MMRLSITTPGKMMSNDVSFCFRAPSDQINTFKKNCATLHKSPPVLIREMIEAFNEGRLKISPTDEQKQLEIYNDN